MLGVVWDFPADWYADIRGPFLVDFSYLDPQCSVFTDCLLLSLDSRAHLFLQTERRTSSRAGIAPGRGADPSLLFYGLSGCWWVSFVWGWLLLKQDIVFFKSPPMTKSGG